MFVDEGLGIRAYVPHQPLSTVRPLSARKLSGLCFSHFLTARRSQAERMFAASPWQEQGTHATAV